MNKQQLEDREVVIWNEVMKARRKSNKLQQTRAEHLEEQPPYKVIRTSSKVIEQTYEVQRRYMG